MKIKNLLYLSTAGLTFTLTSCFYPASADPIGDSFTYASNAIGNVVNSVVPNTPAPDQYTAPNQYNPNQYNPNQYNPTYTVPAQ